MRNFKINKMPIRAMLVMLTCAFVASACIVEIGLPADEDHTWGEMNPLQGMHDSPGYKDQEAQPNFQGGPASMRVPAPGTVPTNFRPYVYGYDDDVDAASEALQNPVAINADTLRYGKLAYETTCIVCHGDDGGGQGYVVGADKYPEPPSLLTQRARNFSDGHIYHIITHGQARMWGYKNQLRTEERWAVVNYLRALQRSQFPEPQDRLLAEE